MYCSYTCILPSAAIGEGFKELDMKILLVLFTIFASISTFASEESSEIKTLELQVESQTCNDSGKKLETDNFKVRIVYTQDVPTQLELLNPNSEVYKLSKVSSKGEVTSYVTSPIDEDHTDMFFVKISKDLTDISLNKSDFMGKDCGGGLIVTKLKSSEADFSQNDSVRIAAKN